MSASNGNKSEVQAKYVTVLPDDVSLGEKITPVYDEPINYETNDNSANMDTTYMNVETETEYVEPNPKITHASEAQVVYNKHETGLEESAFTGSDEDRRENTGNGSKAKTKKRVMLVVFIVAVVLLAVIITALITYFAVKSSNIEVVIEKNDKSRVEGGNGGKEYVLMFTKNFKASLSQVLVTVKVTELDWYLNGKVENYTINSVAGLRKTLDDNMVPRDNMIQSKGVLLNTANDVFVYGMSTYKNGSEHCCSSDGFAAIPVKHWGQNYKVVTLMGGFYKKQIGVVSIHDNTNITFKLNTTGVQEPMINITLKRLQTYQLSRDTDLTGSMVTGTKPFGVYSGDECGYYNESGCSYMVENIPKISDWGNMYIIPPFFNVTLFFVKIVPSTSNAVLTVFNGSASWVYKSNGYLQINLQTRIPILVHGDSTFLLTVYGSFDKQFYFMTTVPSLCQYSNNFILMTSSLKNFHNYVSVIINDKFANGLIFDNIHLSFLKRKESTLTFKNTTWRAILFELPQNKMKYLLFHPDSSVRFGVIQYGVDVDYGRDNYAYPVGLNFETAQQDCIDL